MATEACTPGGTYNPVPGNVTSRLVGPTTGPLYAVGERVGVLKAQEWTTGTVRAVSGSATDGTLRYEVDALELPNMLTTVRLVDKEESELRQHKVDTGDGAMRGGSASCGVDWTDSYNDWTSSAVRMRWKQTWCWLVAVSHHLCKIRQQFYALPDSSAL